MRWIAMGIDDLELLAEEILRAIEERKESANKE